ncbi:MULTISPECIES: cytochrome c(L), periplasmic [Methylobacterium]|jgi:cytochrome c-L|uniref:cytochrome c(L), periplasmic n=1 Tax=Methylobacterium TaxID=407 RepID=UPI0008E65033|nr:MULTISPECIES: cytochrome c(L), periplasmic [Methylobacterium]MBK3397382.1 cytochrome c(L), periplasmic [Methylobacterium ajmalii]MBK3412612.1 cytochrome c(L), periplasmic [Methylobacterium ajmalii]MBK3421623.1 cytochrome c(L), periplasmic [Methylobacterium ajmalii]MBZ6415060.1 cytochrome c(L), periplasmic [Methylobacterium sp.]SFF31540.1 cytochrome cL apoprotein [Methylobacterium sp. yr596]
MIQRRTALGASFGLVIVIAGLGALPRPTTAQSSAVDLRNVVTGEKLDFSDVLPEGKDTPGVKQFLATGHNPYITDASCLKKGEQTFLAACSGCHGHIGEGKIGPGLADNYWTYPQNTTDAGLFSTVFGGANGQMGPHNESLTLDDMLQVTAWVRHLYSGPVADAEWLNDEQKKAYKPYKLGETFPDNPPGMCAKTGKS